MSSKTVRLMIAVAAIVAAGTFAPPASAQGTVDDVIDAAFYEFSGAHTFRNNAGDAVGFLYAVSRQPGASAQSFGGELETMILTGVAYDHTYERAGDHGHYTVQGNADPSGAAPPVPFYGTLVLEYDRARWTNVWRLNLDIGGTVVDYTSDPVIAPVPFE